MTPFTIPDKLTACVFALLCLASIAQASPPPAEHEVHFYFPLTLEDMRARDSLYAARKHALNLNVGEPRTVRMIYFLPNDRPYRAEIVQKMKDEIRNIQTFYRDQMRAHGYGDMTFRFETDAQGEPLVHRLDGQNPDSHYLDETFNAVISEVEQAFDVFQNIYFVVIDSVAIDIGNGRFAGGVGGGRAIGDLLVSSDFHWTTAAHELGHAFGLEHDFRDGAYIMSYGPGWDRLSPCHAEFLSVHPYFNPNIPNNKNNKDTPPLTLELISSFLYSEDSRSISIQLKVSDPDGLHQAFLFVGTREPHFAAGSLEVKACRGLNGERDAVVEFDYDGVVPSDSSKSLSDFLIHPFTVHVVGIGGDVNAENFILRNSSTERNTITILEGHTWDVTSVTFSPDGTTLASGSRDGTIKLWDVATRINTATLEGHTDGVTSVAFSPGVTSVAFSPDGTILSSASDSQDGMVKLWDVATRTNTARLEGHTRLTSIAFSPDGTTLASGSWDGMVKLWDVATRTNTARLEGHTDGVTSVAFSPDGTTLASGLGDGTIKLWDVATRTNIAILEGSVNGVGSAAFSPDGTTLASEAGIGIKLWDVTTWTEIATLVASTTSVVFSPDGTTLASGSGDGMVKLWDVATRTNIVTLRGQQQVLPIYSVAFSPDGTILAGGIAQGAIKLWDTSQYITPQFLMSDFDGDGAVGFPDFLLFVAQFGLSQNDKGYDARFDLDGDGAIGFNDFLVFANHFGQAVVPPGSSGG